MARGDAAGGVVRAAGAGLAAGQRPPCAVAGDGRGGRAGQRAAVWRGGPFGKADFGTGTNFARAAGGSEIRPPAEDKHEPPPAAAPAANGHGDRIAALIADGQRLLNANEPEQALKLFDEALAINPKHAGALVKRGGALEKLERFNDAIACYNQAIAVESSTTMAYLQKGGLFNRLARYDKALQCYEEALRTQEK